jgi:hypothetical protein
MLDGLSKPCMPSGKAWPPAKKGVIAACANIIGPFVRDTILLAMHASLSGFGARIDGLSCHT